MSVLQLTQVSHAALITLLHFDELFWYAVLFWGIVFLGVALLALYGICKLISAFLNYLARPKDD